MAFSFVASAKGESDANATTLDCSTSLNVAEGDLLVALVTWEELTTTVAVAKTTGSPTNAFTFDAGDTTENGSNVALGYKIAAAADATATFRATWTAARGFRKVIVMQFRPDAGETVTKDDSSVGSGSGTSASSGSITTTGADEVAVGGAAWYTGGTPSAEAINSVAAAGYVRNGIDPAATMWYRILTGTFTGAATATGPSDTWVCGCIAFKSAAEGPAGDPGSIYQTVEL